MLKIYFSLICKTPIDINKPKATTGAQIDKISGICQFAKAIDKSLNRR